MVFYSLLHNSFGSSYGRSSRFRPLASTKRGGSSHSTYYAGTMLTPKPAQILHLLIPTAGCNPMVVVRGHDSLLHELDHVDVRVKHHASDGES